MPHNRCSPGLATMRYQKWGHNTAPGRLRSASEKAPWSPPCRRLPWEHGGDTRRKSEETGGHPVPKTVWVSRSSHSQSPGLDMNQLIVFSACGKKRLSVTCLCLTSTHGWPSVPGCLAVLLFSLCWRWLQRTQSHMAWGLLHTLSAWLVLPKNYFSK